MNEQQLIQLLQDATAKVTPADMDKFTITRQQEEQLEPVKKQRQDLPIMIIRVAVAISHLRGIESGILPQDCFELAMKMQDNDVN